jgi:predicted ATP-dependent endonuclease of OLD family
MKAQKLIINKLYGYLSKKIEFNNDINLLVGINGSGKTSVLNILNWILTPSLPHLAVTEFESLELHFDYKENIYIIEILQDDKSLTYKLKNETTNREYFPLNIRLKIPAARLTQNESQKERYFKEYVGLGPDKEETETWAFLYNNLPKPVVIGLDRYLFTEEKNEVIVLNDDIIQRLVTKDNIGKTSPLDEVRKLANREYSIFKNKILELNSKLNNKIMLSAFDEITSESLEELINISIVSIEQVESLHKKVETFFKENIEETNKISRSVKKTDNSISKIESYFTNLKKVIKEAEKAKNDREFTILYVSNISQFKKLKVFIKEFEDFDKKSNEYYSDIKTYLDTINKFLIDSSKELTFHKSLSEITFNVLDKSGKFISKNRDIKTLSSGEKQVLILLTYLKFYNKDGTIFIIDEPELSLHPKWQEEFLNAVRVLTPKNTQIVIATHSPIIVGGNLDSCKVLLPYNN